MKSFLKPTPWRIALAFVLFFLSSWLWRAYVSSHISDTFPWGFPLQFFIAWGPCPPGQDCSEFNGLWLAADLVFWYLVGGLTIKVVGMSKSGGNPSRRA